MDKLKQNLIFFNLIALCFNAYAFTNIGGFSVTLSVCVTAAILIIGFVELILKKIQFNISQLILCFTIISLVFISDLNAILCDISVNFTSTILYVFYFVSFVFSSYKIDKKVFFSKLKIIVIIYTICSLYGIYQFIAYIYDLPVQDIVISGHMVDGFNTSNMVTIGNNSFYRAHSIFLEPSFLSKYAAISIIILVVLYSKRIIKRGLLLICCLINLVAMALSVSGTGIMMLLICCVVYYIRLLLYCDNKKNRHRLIAFGILLVGALLIFAFNNSEWKIYIMKRIEEIFDFSKSGGMRFSAPYMIMLFSFIKYFFGVGAGNESVIIQYFSDFYNMNITFETMASGYAKIGCELGLLGLIAFIMLLFSIKKKDKDFIYIYVIIITINFLGGNLLQTDFWCWMIMFNFIINNNVYKKSRKGVLTHV